MHPTPEHDPHAGRYMQPAPSAGSFDQGPETRAKRGGTENQGGSPLRSIHLREAGGLATALGGLLAVQRRVLGHIELPRGRCSDTSKHGHPKAVAMPPDADFVAEEGQAGAIEYHPVRWRALLHWCGKSVASIPRASG